MNSKTPSILREIAAHKEQEVTARLKNFRPENLALSSRDFKAALSGKSMSLIAEIKSASPSEGKIKSTVDVGARAQNYERAGANAISVLCDEKYFKGSLENMRIAREATEALPILCKDFIVDVRQIDEARSFGADAILVIAALLSVEQMQVFIDRAEELGMDALCEVHNEAELEKVLQTSASIIGINHRNLHDFSIDLNVSKNLIPMIPEDKIIVGESGVSGHVDVAQLHERTDAILVGTAIMKAPDAALKIRSLKQPRPLVKVCGVQSVEEAKLCEELGVDLIGLNFVPSSKRCLDLGRAHEIARAVSSPLLMGVFQNQSATDMNAIAEDLGLDYIQLAGEESLELVQACQRPVLKTLPVREAADMEKIAAYQSSVAGFIIDGPEPGSGSAITQELLAQLPRECFVAGGITPENVPQYRHFFGIDLASGVERDGQRDLDRIRKLMVGLDESSSLRHYLLNNRSGHFGHFGGNYVPELLYPLMKDLADAFFEAKDDSEFLADLVDLQKNYAGRQTPLVFCENLTRHLGGAKIYLKNEGLLHTGAHKMNHCLGQALMAKRMGKTRLIAETGAGQHGLATATVAAKFGMECTIYMGAKDYARQRPNVFYMERLGATVVPVTSGGQILKDAVNAAIGDLISNPHDTHFLLGTVCGPHPYPVMNTFFQKVIGEEVRQQMLEREGRLPDCLVACVGGGSNAMGLFYDFLDEPDVELLIVEAGGKGIQKGEEGYTHAARFQGGKPGVIEGFRSIFLQDEDGQVCKTQSISAGLDYAGVGPQHAYLAGIDRIETSYATDDKVLEAFQLLAEKEGIIAAMESCHAVAEVIAIAPERSPEDIIVFNCSGRGDKDLFITTQHFDKENFNQFLTTFQ